MRDRVVGERFTVRAGDAERELTGGTDLGGRGDLAQQVAVLLERETPHRPGTGRRGVLVVRRRAVLHLAVLHRVRPGRHRLLGHDRARGRGRGGEHHRQAGRVQADPTSCLHQTRTAVYPASSTAASTAASLTGWLAVTTSLPVWALTSICSTPGT